VIRTLIVDDEPLARDGLRVRLQRESDVEIIGEAGDGPGAVDAIRSLHPDLVFLDIQMPGMDGFEILEQVAAEHLPIVVFVTAHDEHALRAFDVHALDYLLKPVADDRFLESLRRARAAMDAETPVAEMRERLAGALDAQAAATAGSPAVIRRFVVKERGRYLLVPAEEVSWIGAAGNYAEIHARGGAHLVRATIADLAARLDPARFARIHRSTIVQIDRIREIIPEWHGDFDVVMEDGTTLRMSRGFRDRLL
jgi:two-component system, LytTR family, response regulator